MDENTEKVIFRAIEFGREYERNVNSSRLKFLLALFLGIMIGMWMSALTLMMVI